MICYDVEKFILNKFHMKFQISNGMLNVHALRMHIPFSLLKLVFT